MKALYEAIGKCSEGGDRLCIDQYSENIWKAQRGEIKERKSAPKIMIGEKYAAVVCGNKEHTRIVSTSGVGRGG